MGTEHAEPRDESLRAGLADKMRSLVRRRAPRLGGPAWRADHSHRLGGLDYIYTRGASKCLKMSGID